MTFTTNANHRLKSAIGNNSAYQEIRNAIEFALAYNTGKVLYVHSGTGANGTEGGRSKSSPLATLAYALSLCTDNKGDIIFLMPGHAENLAAALDITQSGVLVVGIGHGTLLPTFSTTAAAGSIKLTGTNILLANFRMTANFATGTTTGVDITATADGATLRGLQFRDTSTANEFLTHVKVATTVTDVTIEGCSFVTLAGSLTNSILFAGSHTNCVIQGNYFFVLSSDSVIDGLAAAGVNILLKDNFIVNQDTATAGYVIDMHASTTGLAAYNGGAYNKVDAEMTKGAVMWWVENYFSNTVLESGLLEPATSHAIP